MRHRGLIPKVSAKKLDVKRRHHALTSLERIHLFYSELYLLHYNRVNSDLLLPVAVHASFHASFPDTYSQHMKHIVLGSLPEVVFRNTD
jgi:hypothetical protein